MRGVWTLFRKEILRFWKVSFQTVAAPVITALLYLLIFSHVLDAHVRVYEQVRYTAFLVPGLAMMSVLQNAFANSSSSLIQSKVTGNIVFMLLAPLTAWDFFAAYVLAMLEESTMLRKSKPMVFAGIFPTDSAEYQALGDAMQESAVARRALRVEAEVGHRALAQDHDLALSASGHYIQSISRMI